MQPNNLTEWITRIVSETSSKQLESNNRYSGVRLDETALIRDTQREFRFSAFRGPNCWELSVLVHLEAALKQCATVKVFTNRKRRRSLKILVTVNLADWHKMLEGDHVA